jgi:hypothetical protein
MDENIRTPDSIINEQLIQEQEQDLEMSYNKDIEEAIYLSFQETKQSDILNEENEKYEEQLIQQFQKETIERKKKFSQILFTMERLIKIDKEVNEVYEIIEPIIESYCNQMIEVCELDEKTYEKIFYIISKIRLNITNIDLLKTIIVNLASNI